MHLVAAHHVCANLVVNKLLIQARIEQAALLREGIFKRLPYLDALLKLALLIEAAVCAKTATLALNEIPSLLDLLKQLPAGMQSRLEQAIEAEKRGEATHEPCEMDRVALLEGASESLHSAAEALRQPPQSGHLPALGQP